jgi:hypothetical protein
MLRHVARMPSALLKRGAPGVDYTQVSVAASVTDGVDINDPALNLFLRAVLELKPRTVIEIGAYNGARITTLKRLAPGIEAFGLDILPDYAQRSERDGVRFAHFDVAFFDTVASPALVCSRATMSCMPPDAAETFIKRVAARGIDLALCEPVAHRTASASAARSPQTWYHPYDRWLREAGFAPMSDFGRSTRFTFSLSLMENYYVSVARAPTGGR